jgi:hypothetical protein
MWTIKLGMVVFTVRNLIPLYDFERRRELLGRGPWINLIVFQSYAVLINMMLLHNMFDNFVIYEVLIIAATFYGLVVGLYTEQELQESLPSALILFTFALLLFRVFLHIQKKVHKEVFIEMKQRAQEQDEFKVIFNEFEEAILISRKNRMGRVNQAFKKLLSNYFDAELIEKTSVYCENDEAGLYDHYANDKKALRRC